MNAIAICGSPRKDGNTRHLLDICTAKLQSEGIETETVLLSDSKVRPCTGCNGCRNQQDGTCVIKDDDFHSVFNLMTGADIIIVGSPVYFGSATPETMALLDRAGYVSRSNGHLFTRKLGGPLTVARRAGHNFTLAQLLYWFMINDMIVPGSSYWNVAFGRGPGDVENDTEGIATVEHFAENLAWLAKKTVL